MRVIGGQERVSNIRVVITNNTAIMIESHPFVAGCAAV